MRISLPAGILPRGKFARNVAILASGTVFAQVLVVVAMPVLTRIYTPDDFSILAVFVATTAIVTVVANLRYNLAIPLPGSDADAMSLLVAAVAAAVIVSAMCAGVLLLTPDAANTLFGQPALSPFLWMIPLSVLIAATYNALQYWVSRKDRFGLVTRTLITRSIGGVSAQVGLGFLYKSPFGLLVGQLLSEGLGIVGLFRNLLRNDRHTLAGVTRTQVLQQMREYRQFPIYSGPEALLNTASSQLPIVLIAAFAIGPEAGFLFLAMRLLGMPARVIGTSISKVFHVEAPVRLREGGLYELTMKTAKSLLLIGMPPMVLAAVLAPPLIPIIFGEEWVRVGWLIAWMTPSFILQFVASPVSSLLHVMGRIQLAMWLQAFSFVVRVGSVALAGLYAAHYLSEVFAITSALINLLFIAVILHVARGTRREGAAA